MLSFSKKRLVIALGIFLLLVLGWGGLQFLGGQKNPLTENLSPSLTISPSPKQEKPPEETDRFGTSGEILAIDLEKKTLTLKSTDEPRGKIYQIRLQGSTKFWQSRLPPAAAAGQQATQSPPLPVTSQAITLENLQKGGQIYVFSLENLKGKTEFTAERIELLPYLPR